MKTITIGRYFLCTMLLLFFLAAVIPKRADAAEQSYEYEIRELHAQREENDIYGVIYIPKDAGEKIPAVIFSHGFGGTHQTGTMYAEALAGRGYVVYCFDFCGGAPGSRSSGSTLEMSVFTEQRDLEAVLSMIQGLDYVDTDNIFLMGTSQGGVVSALTGAAHPDEIRGMVLLYPAFVLVDNANEMFRTPEEIPETYFFMWMEVGRAYFEPLLGYDVYDAAASYDKDVLLIHGDSDSIVPLSYSEQAVEAYPSAKLRVIPGAGHGFYGEEARQATDWILEYLQARQV
ncbi:MAG TPA: alpha/beta fold hydrolase [Candidatus Choladousia intestinavium]|uniref:Alpha/beta fold hydrolase n=1 Tax=Candidatus Choladousia intestinavium TaxID=2840727 RepID=A0A9D1D8L3_9FIRM|nr:alpha/beta fold hydrolase [Candidatus Choladousia intestinavium]